MEHKNSISSNITVQDIVQVSLMAAVTYIATAVINIPSGLLVKGVVHLGDTMVFVAAVLLGRKKSFLSAGIGMGLFDLLSPYAIWAPFTFFIKGIMAYIASTIAYRKGYNGENVLNNVFGFLLGGLWMVAAYYVSGSYIAHFTMNINLTQAFILTLTHIPGDIAQVAAGTVIAVPLCKVLKKANVVRNK
ncbi:ECF transporter S component [Clostridium sp. JN-1]|jgi:uncharacterized membrane protein|uniref:ECF transporter S component n=1 Tax=Clostridium sp. JN-1 TaxID=2483110 RepID=UPI000F0B57E5|nr:ECF transporter S component [Clostridium sp. JN-1]